MSPLTKEKEPDFPAAVLLFDGICNFCNHSVQFIIKRDPKHYFYFAALQSTFAQNLMESNWPKGKKLPDSILLWEDGKLYNRSTAAIRIAKHLSGLWPIGILFFIFPRFLRDAIYNIVARNRYRWFGKKESCFIEEGNQIKEYFLA